ncbi:Carboxyl/Cholinesterase 22 [Frankliniella occidentalis]|uniref:Carboxylic ester hydrolase n=1 Tax=Frankliniella occidentalis TaxID=133901 RepID=A0A6J1RSW5_FRAOC|nr:juvenile hormone esterase-like [Frankliniella occidentalis]KAE8748914.1 Carboxyl/Cholinesterase 22 [Frankliniella occidentalis]
MASVSRIAILLSALVIFLVLVGVFFGVYLNNNGSSSSTTPSPTTPSPTTHSPNTPSPSPSAPPVTATIVDCGVVEGEWVESAAGGSYAAFRGVPYAEPPRGELRFKGPRPPAKWDGIRSAKEEGNTCFQSGSVGSEDCLYLNVYTPKLPSNSDPSPALPVYVFIHGGVFQYGSGSAQGLGPDFLVAQDIIVVTMNYRLGVLGYLSLDTEEVPGNLGLKDALYALKWVNKNIAAFGGDPSKVTLGGQSSGGVSASWLSILPATKGLIRSAITQSGTAVSSWGLNLRNVEYAQAIYKQITGKDTKDLTDIAKLVYSANLKELYDAAQAATLQLQANKGLGTDISFFYLPTLELRPDGAEDKLITKDPESYMILKEANDIPTILGETKREWALFLQTLDLYKDDKVLKSAIQDLITLVPNTIIPGTQTQQSLQITDEVEKLIKNDETKYVQNIKDHYFLQNTDAECSPYGDLCKMGKYLDHVYIMADTDHFLRLRAMYVKSQTYSYVFNLKSDYNGDYSSFPVYLKDVVYHGNDMNYVWKLSTIKQDYNGNGIASKALRRQVTLLANFIKTGNPTPEKSELITELWLPVNSGEEEQYLEITENLTMQKGSMSGQDGKFWQEIFSHFRVDKSP